MLGFLGERSCLNWCFGAEHGASGPGDVLTNQAGVIGPSIIVGEKRLICLISMCCSLRYSMIFP